MGGIVWEALLVGLQQDPGAEFFKNKILLLFESRCFSCHSAKAEKLRGGLHLDSREGLLHGGDSGPAIVPGEPDRSLLVKAVRYTDEELKMPPRQKLSPAEIADLEAWIKMGAPDPRRKLDLPVPTRDRLWSLEPPKRLAVPEGVNPIDFWIDKKLREKNLTPSPPADKRTLIRRATLDLTGLPPTPEEIDAWMADDSALAFAKVVDRLLASPRYGERWGRHWLDLARYADTKEWVVDEERRLPYAFTYRDWVIRAFNEDLPYDRFVEQQIAADRLETAADPRSLAALGFLTVGRTFLNRLPDIIDDRIDVVSRGLLGLSVQCARCHDHKYDPIPTKDYYSLYGVFASSKAPPELPLMGSPERTPGYLQFEKELQAKQSEITKFKEKRLVELSASFRAPGTIAQYLLASAESKSLGAEELKEFARQRNLNAAMLGRWAAFLKKSPSVFGAWKALAALSPQEFSERAPEALAQVPEMNGMVREALAEPPASLREAAELYGELLSRFDRESSFVDPEEEALRQAVRGTDAAPNMPLAEVEQFFTGDDRGKMKKLRRGLDELHTHPNAPARAMALEDLPVPVAPRVLIRGNAATPGEEVPRKFLTCLSGQAFQQGSGRGELAKAIASRDNPLTARVFVNRVWLGHFGAGLVGTPSDFGHRGEPPTHPELLDSLAVWFMDNGWSVKKLHKLILLSRAYGRSSRSNPDGERVDPRNQFLWKAERIRLDFEALRDSLLFVSGDMDFTMGGRAVDLGSEPFSRRRTVYGHIDRLNLANMYRIFDFAVPDMHAPMRYTTTVPQQALFLMNSPFIQEQAIRLARSPEFAAEPDLKQRIQRMYRRVYGRAATCREVAIGLEYFRKSSEEPHGLSAWERYAQALLASNEFAFAD